MNKYPKAFERYYNRTKLSKQKSNILFHKENEKRNLYNAWKAGVSYNRRTVKPHIGHKVIW